MTVRKVFEITNTITPALEYFRKDQVDKFRHRYFKHIIDANKKMTELNDEFVVSENGKLKTENAKLVFQEGKSEAEFEERRNKILSREV